MEKIDFLPVILGTDWNAYGIASSFKMMYDIQSVLLGMHRQIYTDNLSYAKVYTFDNFFDEKVFMEKIIEFASKNKDKKMLLISCGDLYTGLVSKNKEVLQKYFVLNYIDYDLRCKLENKIDFYNTCEKYDMPYPKTFIVDADNYKDFSLPFDFPVACKPNDSAKWYDIRFEGYKKAYIIDNKEELLKILELAYTNGYDDKMIIQDFIPGGVDKMFVVNAYATKNKKVVMTHAAQTALDECLPNDIGNYNALISGDYEQLDNIVKNFLERIGYTGFANFDFKYDDRDKTYKAFEINLRQGRSSMYMTYAGNNFVRFLVDDMIYDKYIPYYRHTAEHMWYMTAKSVLKKYCAKSLSKKVTRLFSQGKASYGLSYGSKGNIQRCLLAMRRQISTIKYYPKYMR